MATITQGWTVANTSGTVNMKFRYRLMGSPQWTSVTLGPAIRTYTFSATDNYIYDMQVINVNNDDNPASAINQAIGFSDPGPLISPTNTTVSYSFNNLSSDIDSYTCTVAQFSTPGSIIATHILTPVAIVTDIFTGLDPLTQYYLTITPAANQFSETFTYIFTTEAVATCAAPSNTIATLI